MAIGSGARGTASQQQDRRNEADRARGQADRGTRSQQQDRRNMETARAAGNSAPGVRGGGNSGGVRATKLDTRTLNPQTPGWGALGPRGPIAGWGNTPEFNRAMKEYLDRGLGVKALDFLGGSWFDAVKPAALKPETYAGGTYHTGTHVPGVVGGLVGSAFGGPLGGQILGSLAGQIPGGTVLHGGDPALAGYNTGTGVPGASIPGGGTGMANAGGVGSPSGINGVSGVQAAGTAPRPAVPSGPPPMQQGVMPGQTLGSPIAGLGNYQVNTPSYGYFGSPGGAPLGQAGQSAILNPMQGMRPGPRVTPYR